MIKKICTGIFFSFIILNAIAQGDTETGGKLKEIFIKVTSTRKYASWLKDQGYRFIKDYPSFHHWQKLDDLQLFFEKNEIIEAAFHMAPVGFFPDDRAFENNSSYRKIKHVQTKTAEGNTITQKKWVKDGYVYYTDTENWNVGIYKDMHNESALSTASEPAATTIPKKTTSTATPATPPPAAVAATVPATKKSFEFTTMKDLAAVMNDNMYAVQFENWELQKKLSVTGELENIKGSFELFVKSGRLYGRLHIPNLNNGCEWFTKDIPLTYKGSNGNVYYRDEHNNIKWYAWFNFPYTYTCQGITYTRLVMTIDYPDKVFSDKVDAMLKKHCEP